MNLDTTKLFMQFYPWIDKCMYQTFDDAKQGRSQLLRSWNYLSLETLPMLEDINKQWAWVFFSVNWNDNQSRLQKDVTRINAWITEIDHISKEDQMAMIKLSPIRPSMIVESRNWYHLYWFAKDGSIENWNKICRWLRNFFEWDPNVISLERVLRIPWFEHCKNEQDRFEINIVDLAPDKYTEPEMLTAFSNTESYDDRKQKQAKAEAYQKKYESDNDDNFRKRVWDIDSEQMLTILSWTKHVCGDDITFKRNSDNQKQIIVNWKSTWCWIDSAGKIWTWKWAGWWPTRKQRVAWYWHFDWAELYRIIVDKYPAFKPKEKEIKKVVKEQDQEEEDYLVPYNRNFQTDYSSITPFTWGTEWLDNRFWRIQKWMFLSTIWESWSWKTTFAFNQLLQLSKRYKVLFVSLEMDGERVIRLRARKMAWITKQQRDNKTFSEYQLETMERNIRQIKENTNLQIVWISAEAKAIDIDLVLKSILKSYMEYDFITIDNLWFIKAEGKQEEKKMTDTQEANYIIRKIKFFCQDNKKTINLLHHFNKWNSANRKERTFADVMMTSKLEHDIDYAIFISRAIFDPKDFEEASPEERAMVFVDLMKDREEWQKSRQIVYFSKWWYTDNFIL